MWREKFLSVSTRRIFLHISQGDSLQTDVLFLLGRSFCASDAIFSAVRQSNIKCLLLYLYTSVGAYAFLIYEQHCKHPRKAFLNKYFKTLIYTVHICSIMQEQRFGPNVLCKNHFFPLLTESVETTEFAEFADSEQIFEILECTCFWKSIGV